MPRNRPLVIVTRKLPDAIETRMMELFDTRLNADDTPADQGRAGRGGPDGRRAGADGDRPHRQPRALPGRPAPEADRLVRHRRRPYRLDAARQRGITVTNTPGVLTEDTADMTMALILAAARRMGEGERLVRAGEMDGLEPDLDAGPRGIYGKRLGIVGMGRIGQRAWRGARAASACPSTITTAGASTPSIEHELEATYWESLDQMLARMDIVVGQLPAHAGDLPSALGAAA